MTDETPQWPSDPTIEAGLRHVHDSEDDASCPGCDVRSLIRQFRTEVAQLRGAGERNRKYVQYLIDEHGRISSELAVVNRDWLLLRNTEEIDAEVPDRG